MTIVYICGAAAIFAMLLGSAFPWWGYIIILFVSIINNYIAEKSLDYMADLLVDAQDPNATQRLEDAINKMDRISDLLDKRTVNRMNSLSEEEFDEFLAWCHKKEHEDDE